MSEVPLYFSEVGNFPPSRQQNHLRRMFQGSRCRDEGSGFSFFVQNFGSHHPSRMKGGGNLARQGGLGGAL